VPIYYESRISRLSLNAAELPTLDSEFEEITESEELTKKEKLKSKWAALEALVGDPKRIALVAADMVAHFQKRWEAMDGKAMIVCMSRRIAVDLYNAIIALRPDWASAKDDDAEAEKGKACVVKVVMTGSADDGPDWQPHIRNKEKRRHLANRFKDAKDPFRIVIVRDMWLTGFDAPCLHTMYADKPMQGHGLMQAIAVMLEKHGIACDMLHGFNWDKWTTGKPAERLALLPAGQEHILQQEDGKARWVQVVMELSSAFALSAASDEAVKIRDDVSFFQALQNARVGARARSRGHACVCFESKPPETAIGVEAQRVDHPHMVARKAETDPTPQISESIRVFRGHRVLTDADLALLYGVTTARLNQQFRRNRDRFPADFAFEIPANSEDILMLQNATSSPGHGGRRKPVVVFTEHGAIMAATILNSPRAVQMIVYIVRAFVRFRQLTSSHAQLAKELETLKKAVVALDTDTKRQFDVVYEAILGLMGPKSGKQ
jgi:hypothetical protein